MRNNLKYVFNLSFSIDIVSFLNNARRILFTHLHRSTSFFVIHDYEHECSRYKNRARLVYVITQIMTRINDNKIRTATRVESTEKRRFNRKSSVRANVENENEHCDEVNGQWRFVLTAGRIFR